MGAAGYVSASALALRARIVLACAEGKENKQVAAELRVREQTGRPVAGRFTAQRLDGRLTSPARDVRRQSC